MRSLIHRLIYLIVIVFLGFGVGGCGSQGVPTGDVSVGSDDPNGTGATSDITEGVVGQVTSLGGLPIEGARVPVESLDVAVPEIAILTNGDGRYVWGLPPGTYDISVFADGYQSQRKQIMVGVGQVMTVDFTLEHSP